MHEHVDEKVVDRAAQEFFVAGHHEAVRDPDAPAPAGASGTGAFRAVARQLGEVDRLAAADRLLAEPGSLPATVIAVNGAVGQQPGQPVLELASKDALTLTGELPPAYAGQVKAGLKVQIYDEVTGIRAAGTVAELGSPTETTPSGTVVSINETGSSASSGSAASSSSSSSSSSSASSSTSSSSSSSGSATTFVPLTVRPSSPLPAALNGENVLVTVDTGQTEGPVLTVPDAAVVATASGTSQVTVVDSHGRQTQVAVTPGISENGYVQVTPASPGSLKAGENVVVSG